MRPSIVSSTLFLCGLLLMTGDLAAVQVGSNGLQQNQTAAGQGQPVQQQRQQGQANYEQQLRQQAATAAPRPPAGFPLPQTEQQYIEQLLQYWEGTSNQINQYRCDIRRFQHDHEVCNYRNPKNNQLAAAMISLGKVRYSAPDKGMYEIDQKWQFKAPPREAGADPEYDRPAAANPEFSEREKWICDGLKIYEYDYQNKRLYESTLPAEMQGDGLKNSPLPFVFGAKAAELLDRFWIRDVTPQQVRDIQDPAQQQYWLEAWPKRPSDAQAYSKIEIILSRQPFLPQSIHMYAPNYDRKLNPSKMVFEFANREINGGLAKLQDFADVFINPKKPGFGWKRVTRDLVQNPANFQQEPRIGQSPQTASPRK